MTTGPNPLLPLAKRNCMTKNFETHVIPRRKMPFRKRNSRGIFCSYKRETCEKSKSSFSLTYPPERPCKRNSKKKFFSSKDHIGVRPYTVEPRYKEPTNDFLYLDNSKIYRKTHIKAPCQISPLPLISPPFSGEES